MKTIHFLLISILFFSGCTDQEKKQNFEIASPIIESAIKEVIEQKIENKNSPDVEKIAINPEIQPVEIKTEAVKSDLDFVQKWNDRDVKSWITNVKLQVKNEGSRIRFICDSMPWPEFGDTKLVNGNIWIIVKRNDIFEAQTWEWFRGSNFVKDKSKLQSDAAGHMHGNWQGWKPETGKTYYFFLSARVRDGNIMVCERSNVVELTWIE